jgi:hypothetical protein
MNINPSDNVAGQPPGHHQSTKSAKSRDALVRGVAQADAAQAAAAQQASARADAPLNEGGAIRKQLVVVQRSLGRHQSILGGLEGFLTLLESSAHEVEATRYIDGTLYRGEALLQPFREELINILKNKNRSALRRMIEKTTADIHVLGVQLSRLETAEQNSRSIASGIMAASDILEGIRKQGDQLLNPDRKNVLDLLG